MSLTRRIAHNTLVQLAGKIASVALGVAVITLMTRRLGPEGYGYYTTVVAFLQIFGILVDFGLTLTTLQFLSLHGANTSRILGTMLTMRLATAIPFFGAAIVVGMFMPYPMVVKVGIAILAFEFLATSLIQVLVGLFQKELATHFVALAELAGRTVLLVGVIVTLQSASGLLSFLAMIVLASIVHLLFLVVTAQRFTALSLTFDKKLARSFLATSWPIGVSIAFNLIYLKSDTLILSLYRKPEEVGIYGAPYRVLEILVAFPYLFVGLIFPILRNAWASDKMRFQRVLQKSFDALALCAIPLVVGTIILATPLMVLIAGPAFAASGPLLQLLIVATGLIFMGTLFGHVVLVVEKQRPMIGGYAATAAVALAGYLFFIPRYGAPGAAWVTIFAEAMIAAITFLVTWRVTRMTLSWLVAGKALVASLCMLLALRLFSSAPVLLAVVIGALTYGIALLALRAVHRDVLKEILS